VRSEKNLTTEKFREKSLTQRRKDAKDAERDLGGLEGYPLLKFPVETQAFLSFLQYNWIIFVLYY